jgi:hypothetical protein
MLAIVDDSMQLLMAFEPERLAVLWFRAADTDQPLSD